MLPCSFRVYGLCVHVSGFVPCYMLRTEHAASFPGHSQILSHSCGEPEFSPQLRDKSGSGLGILMRLLSMHVFTAPPFNIFFFIHYNYDVR